VAPPGAMKSDDEQQGFSAEFSDSLDLFELPMQ
jgi:hypothetical protein